MTRDNLTPYEIAMRGLNSWKRSPFNYGSVDCCQFIGHMIENATGRDYRAQFQYASEQEAYQLVSEKGSLLDFLESVLGAADGEVQDGDPVVCELPVVGEFAGIKLGDHVVCLTEKGMIRVPESKIICGWSLCRL